MAKHRPKVQKTIMIPQATWQRCEKLERTTGVTFSRIIHAALMKLFNGDDVQRWVQRAVRQELEDRG